MGGNENPEEAGPWPREFVVILERLNRKVMNGRKSSTSVSIVIRTNYFRIRAGELHV